MEMWRFFAILARDEVDGKILQIKVQYGIIEYTRRTVDVW
jgi:hypothetical protein